MDHAEVFISFGKIFVSICLAALVIAFIVEMVENIIQKRKNEKK